MYHNGPDPYHTHNHTHNHNESMYHKQWHIMQGLEASLAEARAGGSAAADAAEREWSRRLGEVELQWEKRLRDGCVACACPQCICAAGDGDVAPRTVLVDTC